MIGPITAMRVALFTDTFYPQINGVARTVERTAFMLIERGYDVTVVTASADAKETYQHGEYHYNVLIIPSLPTGVYKGERIALPFFATLSALKQNPPDLIHTHTPFGVGLVALRAAKELQVPLVGTHHTFFDHYLDHIKLNFGFMQRITWRYTAWYYNHCDIVLSPTQSLLDTMQSAGLRSSTMLVANPTDTRYFTAPSAAQKEATKKSLHISGPVVLYLGRLSYEKSVDQALHAFAKLLKTQSDAFLVVAGDGPERERLEELAHALAIEDSVMFTGFVSGEKLIEALQASDVCLSASKSENMPLAILEALASGLPVVAVRSLGMSELVKDGVSGYLVDPDDTSALAARVGTLLSDEKLRTQFSEEAMRRAKRYDPSVVAEELLRAYEAAKKSSE